MPPVVMQTRGHTGSDGRLRLDMNVGIVDADVTVVVQVTPTASAAVDDNGWPVGYFETVAGSMPDLERWPQGDFESRLPL